MKRIKEYLALLLAVFFITGCEIVTETGEENDDNSDWDNVTGLDTEEEEANYNTIPKELSIALMGDVPMSSSCNLRDYMPPIKSQGSYGTCTSWATGYYSRTILNARENGLTAADLTDMDNVFSPLDIYLSIGHGANCGGSAISTAFATMQERGIARFSEVPYENLGDCSQSSPASSSQYEKGKIDHYRTLDVSLDEFKVQLELGNPIAVGCNTGDETQLYRGGVMMSDNGDGNGGHAMCVVGFDDEKGPNGAMLVANSWDTWWGDEGFLWVDYDFFFSGQYCEYAFVLEADKGVAPVVDSKVVDPNFRSEGKDALAITLEDRPGDVWEGNPEPGPRDRSVQYDVFNKGNEQINASDDWCIVYYYYNAYDPEGDFGIIFYDYYTDDVEGQASKGSNGDFADVTVDMKKYSPDMNWWNYVDVPAGYSVGKAVDGESEADMIFDYEIPSDLNGEYYFVLYADGFNAFDEAHEQNNFLFFTGEDRAPITIVDGVVSSTKSASGKKATAHGHELKESYPNTYSVEEIARIIEHQKESGELGYKAQFSLKSSSFKAVKRTVRN